VKVASQPSPRSSHPAARLSEPEYLLKLGARVDVMEDARGPLIPAAVKRRGRPAPGTAPATHDRRLHAVLRQAAFLGAHVRDAELAAG
jgi:hypothetical protein